MPCQDKLRVFRFTGFENRNSHPRITFLVISAVLLLLFASSPSALANNVRVRNAALVERDTSADTIQVQFDISWQNAWSDSINHDAVWIFVKYNTTGASGNWKHATLKRSGTNPTGFSTGTRDTTSDSTPTVAASDWNNITIVVPSDLKGAFIKPGHLRDSAGTINFDSVQLVWDYGADGVTDAEARGATMSIKVFAIEMVYIPEGGFIAGDGAASGTFEYGNGTQNIPPAVTSEGAISFRNNSSNAWYYNTDNSGNDAASGAEFDVSESFPKGFQAFYLMKHEISQGGYAEFLNTLSTTQDSGRYPSSNGTNRHTIGGSAGSRSASRPYRAANFLNWTDITAFADWAALRPITELEYEKAARGPLNPVVGEYAWGTTTKANCTSFFGAEDGTEDCVPQNAAFGNSTYSNGDGGSGPVRVGIFAEATNTREASGAGFYGNLDLTGNVGELVVTLGHAYGRGFSGTHGDGVLDSNGNATNDDWPGRNSTVAPEGQGSRGGSWSDTTDARGQISDRYNAAEALTSRQNNRGGRAARTAP